MNYKEFITGDVRSIDAMLEGMQEAYSNHKICKVEAFMVNKIRKLLRNNFSNQLEVNQE